MEFVFAYLAGVLTLINPCVLPVLPIVLASSLQASPRGPMAIAAGMSLSFVILGLSVTVVGRSVGLTEDDIAKAGAVLMILFGLVLLVPQFSARFAAVTSGFADRADSGMDHLDRNGLFWQFLGGMLLGAVWSPCIGPTLGTAIGLASQGESIAKTGIIMVFFAAGVSTIIIALGYGARSAIQKRQALMRRIADKSRPILGLVFLLVGLGILFEIHKMLEFWAMQILPTWLVDLSVRF